MPSKKKEILALTRRIEDLATGANGSSVGANGEALSSHDYCLAYELGIEGFGRLLSAVADAWPEKANPNRLDITGFWAFGFWDKPMPEVVEWLYRLGVRADTRETT